MNQSTENRHKDINDQTSIEELKIIILNGLDQTKFNHNEVCKEAYKQGFEDALALIKQVCDL